MQGELIPQINFLHPELAKPDLDQEYSIVPLTDLKTGQNGMIIFIDDRMSNACKQLMEMGVSIHSHVRVFSNQSHHLIFDVNGKRIAADWDTAMKIKVQIPARISSYLAANPM